MKYLINYNTGAGNEWYENLEEAKANANFSYTQESVVIEDEQENEILIAKWWGTAYDEEVDGEEPVADFGFGYYENWREI